MNIIITIPKKIKWEDYKKELETVVDGSQMMLFKIPFKPKHDLKGNRCYVCYNGCIQGWMEIVDVIYSDGFTCSTTGTVWPEGWYICRSGKFHLMEDMVLMKGFRGIRYVGDM